MFRARIIVRLLLPLLAVGAIALGWWSGEPSSADDAPATDESSEIAGGFAFADINPASKSHGQTLSLDQLRAERGLVLQFVASWCKPCRDELPDLQKLHVSDRAKLVLIAADEYGYSEGILTLAERHALTVPILFVPEDQAAALEQAYDHEMLPATYLIDRDGRIVAEQDGVWSLERMIAAVERYL